MTEKQKIDRVLESVIRTEEQVVAIREEQHQIASRVESVERWRVGNGAPGMDRRVDRLERSETRRGRIEWTVVGAALVAAAGVAIKFVVSGALA